jgi:Zn-dependent peptidase ImmA (M78 family)
MIPKRIKIGCYTYDIEHIKQPIISENKVCYGTIDFDKNIISLNASYGKQVIEQTFWHEVMHGFCHERGIEMPSEEIINTLASAIYGFIKDNKGKLPGQE